MPTGGQTRVFVASAMPTGYPYKLQKPSTISARVRETADCFIMDSGIGDDVSNREVIELAIEHDADYVVAKDYLHKQDKTTDSIREFVDIFSEYDCDITPLIPLQPPFAKHYRDVPEFDHYVLGGMATEDIGTDQQIRWIRDFRRVAPDVYAHGLGVGGGIEFVRKVAGTGLLDSIDCSTPEQAAMFGKVLNETLQQQEVRVGNGEGISKRNIPLAAFNSWQVQDVWDRESQTTHRQATL